MGERIYIKNKLDTMHIKDTINNNYNLEKL